ncbi:MAG: SPOR domain-containing protein, partial [Proteobacteria bacterium]|nr:SPOR domain-containing protein [Pseudomonadota bacterium]
VVLFVLRFLSLTPEASRASLGDNKHSQTPKESSFFYHHIGSTPVTYSQRNAFPLTSSLKKALSTLPTKSKPAEKYTVMVGHTKTEKEANRVLDELNLAGMPAFITPVSLESGRKVFRISMGLFAQQEEAREAKQTLRDRTSYNGEVATFSE